MVMAPFAGQCPSPWKEKLFYSASNALISIQIKKGTYCGNDHLAGSVENKRCLAITLFSGVSIQVNGN